MNEIKRLQQAKREQLRWRLLCVAYVAGTLGVGEHTMIEVVNEVGGNTDLEQVRQELCYLEGKELLEIDRGRSRWTVTITPTGIDVREGTVGCPPGIACEKEG